MKNNYNYWMVSTLFLLTLMSLFAGVTSKWQWQTINLFHSGKVFIILVVAMTLLQLPEWIRLYLKGRKNNVRED